MTEEKAWFANWFDTPYYHILYKNRDYTEAQQFIDTLIQYLNPKQDSRILDLACGSGRHSRHLASLGFQVTGVDLSRQSIEEAAKYEQNNLEFFIHDMRDSFRIRYFDYIFNIFTSFGYFNTKNEHIKTLKNIKKGLKNDGVFVLDFFNAHKTIAHLKSKETKVVDNIHFDLKRYVNNGIIHKEIRFKDKGQDFFYTEKVHAFHLDDFKSFFEIAGLQIIEIFGDYQLSPYNKTQSDRLILMAKPI